VCDAWRAPSISSYPVEHLAVAPAAVPVEAQEEVPVGVPAEEGAPSTQAVGPGAAAPGPPPPSGAAPEAPAGRTSRARHIPPPLHRPPRPHRRA